MCESKESLSLDKRESKRFAIKGNTYALLKQPQYTELGKILDISSTGISFLCLNEGDWSETPFQIDIILEDVSPDLFDENSPMTDIPLQPVLYSKNSNNDGKRSDYSMKRCGVKFGELNQQQKKLIDFLIMQHSQGHA